MSPPEIDDEPPHDEIIAKVRAIRDALAARFDYDLDRLFDEAKRRERASDRDRIVLSPERLSTAGDLKREDIAR